jgi:hypothetical protein
MAQQQYNSSLANHLQRQCSMSPSLHAVRPRRRERGDDERRRQIPGNQSMVDMRSLEPAAALHRTLVEELIRTAAPLLQHRRRRREHRLQRAGLFSAVAARGRVDDRGRRGRDDDNKHHQYIML